MAEKNKVPVAAIRKIIELRNDEYHNHTYKVIAERIQQEFCIEVTLQAVRYLYEKNKDKYSETIGSNKQENPVYQKPKTDGKKPIFKPKKSPALSEPVFEKDEAIDIKNLFEEAE